MARYDDHVAHNIVVNPRAGELGYTEITLVST